MANVLFLENHKEVVRLKRFHWYGSPWDHFWHFKELLDNNNFNAKSLKKGTVKNRDLKGFDILMIGLPQETISDEEIQVIKNFVSDGGGLLLAGGAVSWPTPPDGLFGYSYRNTNLPRLGGVFMLGSMGPMTFNHTSIIENLNQVSSIFGIKFESELIEGGKNYFIEKSHKRFEVTAKCKSNYPPPIITSFLPHPIVNNLSGFVVVDGVPLRISENIQALGFSDKDTQPAHCIVLASTQFGSGKVVGLSSPSIFLKRQLPYGLYQIEHLKLSVNIINWLTS